MSEVTSGLLEISLKNVKSGTSSPPDFCGGAGRHDPYNHRTNNLVQLRRSVAHDSAAIHTWTHNHTGMSSSHYSKGSSSLGAVELVCGVPSYIPVHIPTNHTGMQGWF